MILQALKEYYDRKAADPQSGIAPQGFERKALPFLIVIKPDGQFVNLEDTRERVGKRLVGKPYLLPRSKGRSGSRSFETTFLLWDHRGYLLGSPEDDPKASKQHETWLGMLAGLPTELRQDEGVAAMLAFYRSGGVARVKAHPGWGECAALPSCNMAFRLVDDKMPVPCRSRVQEYVRTSLAVTRTTEEDGGGEEHGQFRGRCLVTGDFVEIARTHGRTPINKDTKSLVAFQRDCGFDSYGKGQGYNASVGKPAEFAYTTALNTLLQSESQRMQVGDATTVFWAAQATEFETGFLDFFAEPPKDDPDRGVRAVESLFRAVESGALPPADQENRFYVLGLAPNAARIAVRFWLADTVAGMAGKVRQHFEDLRIAHGPRDRDVLSLFRLLCATAAQGKADNIPPNLAGDTMRAILEGLPYPATLLQAAVRRNRAEQDVTYPRAALLKACLNRKTRYEDPNQKEELHVSLDPANTNIGYRLGRLFAVLERVQADALGNPNATIRDRYYGAASGTPATVFGTLTRLSNHHLSKLERDKPGLYVIRRRLLGEIMSGLQDFPAHLSLADQGCFAIGYYHQTQDFFTRKTE